MALKVLKPTTASRRNTVLIDHKKVVTTKRPTRSLTSVIKKPAGRSHGTITVRHKGGAMKKRYRIIDFKRSIRDIAGKISTIEYDPNRNVYISLVVFTNGQKCYILTPANVKVGQQVMAGDDAPIEFGNALPLNKMPVGSEIHNIEVNRGSGGVLVRSAGMAAVLMGFDDNKAQIKLPSKEVRVVNANCYATLGVLSNSDHKNVKIGKAGRNRRKGIRPSVRGMVMAPNDHPHGGGEGKGQIGHVVKDVWGNIRGKNTRRKKNRFTRNILVTRKGRKVIVK